VACKPHKAASDHINTQHLKKTEKAECCSNQNSLQSAWKTWQTMWNKSTTHRHTLWQHYFKV